MLPTDYLRAANSWCDLSERISHLSAKEKGDVFESLVLWHLRVDPIYSTRLENVWLGKDVPSDVHTQLGIPLKDYGIDLVAQTKEGTFWAVQAKYRSDEEASIPWDKLSSFIGLTFGVSKAFEHGLICTTTDRITPILQGNPRVGLLASDHWSALDEEAYALIRNTCSGRASKPEPRVPHPHQTEAILAAEIHFNCDGNTRGKFISPCGSGKTLTAWWMMKALGAKRVIFAVPSLPLISQTLSTWLREAVAENQDVGWLCVCSDDTTGAVERDPLIAHVNELGVPAETDPGKLSLALRKLTQPLQIIFTTYQSSPSLGAALHKAGWECDLAVLDEAHKTVTNKASRRTYLLSDANLPIKRRIFMTATERHFKGESDEVVSMDDPALYGEMFHLLSFKRALESSPPILCDYEVLTIGLRDSEITDLIENRRYILDKRGEFDGLTANAFASLVALRKAVANYGIKHAVSFHTRVDTARQFTELCQKHNADFPELQQIKAFHVSGAMPSTQRERELRTFQSREQSLVTNARCLTEGVDVPGIDCVMFVDQKESAVDIVQAAGRAMRLAPGKSKAYIILPFVVREEATVDDAAAANDFGTVVAVLRALASQDERIIDELHAIYSGRQAPTKVLNFDLSEIVPTNINLDEFVRGVELRCWGRLKTMAFMSYEDAKIWVQCLGINTQKAFRNWRRGELTDVEPRPATMPSCPDKWYAGRGWTTWGEFCGTGAVSSKFVSHLSHDAAREYLRPMQLSSGRKWDLFRQGKLEGRPKRPVFIPARPDDIYADKGWISWAHFLSYESKPQWRSFQDALRFVRALQLRGHIEWRDYCAGRIPQLPPRPRDIPTSPRTEYADQGWVNLADWLGTKVVTPLPESS